MTEDEIREQVRETFEAANYVRAHCPPEEYEMAVRDVVTLTRWHRERQQ
jgi:hypothetical protein